MRTVMDPGRERRSICFTDNVPFSTVKDDNGNTLTLRMSLMLKNGKSEMRLASGRDDDVFTGKQKVMLWINGAGFRACDKNLMSAEMEFLAEAGYAVAFCEYRHSGLAKWPAQIIDVKSAIRFLRSHAAEYSLDPDHIGVIGRSAGGMLAAWCAMNTPDWNEGDDCGVSSRVQVAVDMFGPADLTVLCDINKEMVKDPSYRWHDVLETHEGALLGPPRETLRARAAAASPIRAIGSGMCPILILHGDQDPLVPCSISEDFYARLVKAGLEERSELVILKNGGHGTREFFQYSTRERILDFLKRRF